MKSDAVFAKFTEALKEVDQSKRTFTPVIQYHIRNSSGVVEKKMGKIFLYNQMTNFQVF